MLIERPGSGELAFFVPTDRQTDHDDRQTRPITLPLAHVRGVIINNELHLPKEIGRPRCYAKSPNVQDLF